MTPTPSVTASLPNAPVASMARGQQGVFGVGDYWPGYWFSAGVPAAGS